MRPIAYDRIIELDLDVVAIDGSIHKAPCGGERTGKGPVDRGKLGWKWSLAVDAAGIPIGAAIDGANRNDIALLERNPPTLDAIKASGLLPTNCGTGPHCVGADLMSLIPVGFSQHGRVLDRA